MIKVSLEVYEGGGPFRMTVRAESIGHAVSILKERFPGRNVRVVFPIDSEEFFIQGPEKLRPDESRQPLHDPLIKVR